MNTKKQVARKLIETILFNHVSQLLRKTKDPAGLIQYFESYAALGKFDRDLIIKAVQYFMQLSFRFEVNRTNAVQLCVALHISSSAIYKLCPIKRARLCDIKRERDKTLRFLDTCTPAQFSYTTDCALNEFYIWMLELSPNRDEDLIEAANTIKEILERDEDEYLEI